MDDPQPALRAAPAARLLLRAARVGALATHDEGTPFASLVTPATAPDLTPLLLLSDLAAHTRHLRADPRCTLLVQGAPAEINPQTAPRVSVTARAEIAEDPALRARFLAIHPYAAQYAGFADFHLWRLVIDRALFVGGFARAARVRAADLRPDRAAGAAIAAAEAGILARAPAAADGGRAVSLDADGFDLSDGTASRRVAFPAPATDAADAAAKLLAALG
ncbi:MAG: pyridoxamine 5'-phosphate oxidase family protein [Acetobacteraceae bacterium]